MRRTKVLKLSVTALCIALNMIGGTIALWLKLPVYLDSVGTILAGGLLGPLYGGAAGLGSALLCGFTSDVYALYFMPVGAITGLMAGVLFRKSFFRGFKMVLGTAVLTVPGTAVSASISAFLFGGVTSSGSSLLVQLFRHLGFSLMASAFAVQILTDYADRLISCGLVMALMACLTVQMKRMLRGGDVHGTL